MNILVVLALALRSLLPAGYMLQGLAAGGGAVTIVICTDHGASKIRLDADGRPVPAESSAKESCPFSLASSGWSPAPLVAQPMRTTVAQDITWSVLDTYRGGPNWRDPSVSARGPPLA